MQPKICNPGNEQVTLLTAKTGRRIKAKCNRTDSRLPANGKQVESRLLARGKKTGKLMGIMPVTTGKSMERIITTAAAIGAEDTMEDTRQGECWQAWRSVPC